MSAINRRGFLKGIGGGVAVVSAARFSRADGMSGSRPNIILIMSDDMGYSDIGCYGSEIETPILDGLAEKGLRFTRFYNTARCCPTRASLMTGLYQHQAGVGHMMGDRGVPGYKGDLNTSCVTIAEAMKTAGYSCYMSGKWHVTKKTRPDGSADKHNWPCQRGYDRFYGTIHGAGSFFDPNTLTRDNEYISPCADPEYTPKQYYYTDAISDHAVRFIGEHTQQNPFFMYVSYTTAHWPMHALEEDIAKYKGKYDDGYEAVRKARYEKMKKLCVIENHWNLSPRAGDWGKVKHKDWEARCMEVYAAMVDRMDAGIGKIVRALKQKGQLDNTLIFFLQDNGGCAEGLGRRPRGKRNPGTRPDKPLAPMDPKALQPDMIPKKTRDGWPLCMGPGVMPGPADTYIAYGRAWANVSNTPFREYKHWVHEGGIATPLIVHWPDKVGDGGALRHEPSHVIDIMATCADVAGATYPETYKGNRITPMEGTSLAPVFAGKKLAERALFWEHERNCAVRIGKWKLVCKGGLKPDGVPLDTWELYDMAADRSELNDLSKKQPDRVKEMAAVYEKWLKRAHVLPFRRQKKKGGKK